LLTDESPPRRSPEELDPVALASRAAAGSPCLDEFVPTTIDRIDNEIELAIARDVGDPWMRAAIAYQFGWVDSEFVQIAPGDRTPSGKRLRPLLSVLSFRAVDGALGGGGMTDGGETPAAVLAVAAAVELVHNFSLIHDDIVDRDRLRRGRPTLWTVCGEAQAINVGDCVQALAYACLGRLEASGVDPLRIGQIVSALATATIDMTIGQRRDMTYEQTGLVDIEMYSTMIAGKTAALMSCATYAGARLAAGGGGHDAVRCTAAYAAFGRELGLCFQIRDDILGIWGHEADTGESTGGDIRRRKKSLPIVLALATATGAAHARLAELYALDGELDAGQEREVREILEACDAQARCQQRAEIHAARALDALASADASATSPFVAALRSLTGSLTARSS
jgi:geranylgeranyl diphosphate synthase, type I